MELTRNDIDNIADIVAERILGNLSIAHMGRWLTVKEAMAYAKVKSVNTIREWIKQGYIKGHKRGGNGDWIIDRQSIDDWYQGHN